MKSWFLALFVVPFVLNGQDITAALRKNIPGQFSVEERGDGAPRSEDDDDGIALQRQRAAIVWASLQALPRAQNELLQSIHVRSLTRARLIAPPPEQPFLAKLWAQPSDLFALEEYEGYLRATGEVNRAKRVSRMLDDVKRARQEARQAQGAAPEESGA